MVKLMKQRILALICARSGSKGLKNKNIQLVGNKTMLERAVCLAKDSMRQNEKWNVVVSTDSKKYAQIAKSAGASVPFIRPKKLATDKARLIDSVLHCLGFFRKLGEAFDVVLLLSAATPLTLPLDVRKAILLYNRNKNSVAAITESKTPKNWCFKLKNDCLFEFEPNKKKPRIIKRRQESDMSYYLNGALYIASPNWLYKYNQFVMPGKTAGIIMPRERSVDVEDKLDLEIANFLQLTANKANL